MTWLEADDRLSALFDIAQRGTAADLARLSVADQREVMSLRHLLERIDGAWFAPESAVDRVDALFLRKLAAEEPHHPWVQGSIVHTLGELIQASGDPPASLPEPVYAQLAQDPTPVEQLLASETRTRAAGMAAQRAAVPHVVISDFILWINRLVASLVPPAGPQQQGLVFPRHQAQRRKGPKNGD
ncbi:MAG: hypothetical protein M3R24_06330 [Chloroflexota bacterium]|nr:hypothetical protein [Chloroflexota bacterium]